MSGLRFKFGLAVGLLLPATGFCGIMMQGFYWDVTPQGGSGTGSWYYVMQQQAAHLKSIKGGYGINRIWFPPPSKGDAGGYSAGYDVYDYYDLGTYNQKGWTATRYGLQADLKSCIAAYHAQGIDCMADIVLNHRTGASSESNPNTGGSSWTNFSGVASGMCKWHYNEFHPSTFEGNDEGTFGGYPDVCHATGNSAGHAYYDQIHWGQWLQNTANAGFDGWRFDATSLYHSWMVHDFRASTGNPFSVGEGDWGWSVGQFNTWTAATGASLFDFGAYWTLKNICNNGTGGGYLPDLVDSNKCYAANNPTRAVTFAANHDVQTGSNAITQDKMIAYAYILTYKGYPCIFWKDYYDWGLATLGGQWGNGIDQLVWVHERLEGGGPTIQNMLTNNGNLLIYGDSNTAHPGTVVCLNDDPSNWKSGNIVVNHTGLRNKNLKCYAWYSSVSGQNAQPNMCWCDGSGNTTVWAPPRGYAVYAPDGY